MILFPVIEHEPIVQENDKTRLDAQKSFGSGGTVVLTTKIRPSKSSDYVEASDKVLDWAYAFELDVHADNKKIQFKESGSELTATLTEGVYTLANLAAEIATAMNAAVGKTLTYSATVSDDALVISANGSFTLLYDTASLPEESLLPEIGVSADTAGNSVTGATVETVNKTATVRIDNQITIDDSNDKLDYAIDTLGNQVATIAHGDYATFEDFLDAVLEALNDNVQSVVFEGELSEEEPNGKLILSASGFPAAYTSGPLVFSQPFTSSTGFSFNAAQVEFTGGLLRQLDQRPANNTFWASFASSIDGNWGGGTLTGTNTNATYNAGLGRIDMLGGVSAKYVDWSATGNGDSLQVGCSRVKVIPNYSGTPPTAQHFLRRSQANGSNNNALGFFHNTNGNISVRIFNNAGVSILTADLGVWAPVAGTQYELEFNFDITAGQHRFFINGVQFGGTQAGTGTRSGAVALMRSGEAQTVGVNYANFSITSIQIFSTVQHTANYTPGADPSETIYLGAEVALPSFVHSPYSMLSLTSFTTTEAGAPHYIVKIGSGLYKYWNGSAWVTSDHSYAQANPAATIAANIASLSVTAETTVTISMVFQASNTLSSVDALTLNYVGQLAVDPVGFDILCSTGVNVDTSAWELLGFTGADKLGHGTFSYTGTAIPSVKFKSGTLQIISESADFLYSDDQQLRTHENDILKYVSEGRATFKDIHRQAQTSIIDFLNKNGWVDNLGEKLSKEHLIDKTEVKEWSKYMALRMIFEGNINSDSDVFEKKAKYYRGEEVDARKRLRLLLDLDKDGVVEAREEITPFQSGFLVRR